MKNHHVRKVYWIKSLQKLLGSLIIEERHLVLFLVISGHAELDDVEAVQARGHVEDAAAVSRLVEISGFGRMRDSGGVAAHNVKSWHPRSTRVHPSLRVPLHLENKKKSCIDAVVNSLLKTGGWCISWLVIFLLALAHPESRHSNCAVPHFKFIHTILW